MPRTLPASTRRAGRRRLLVGVTVGVVAAGCGSGRSPADPGTIARGQEIYEASCVGCHGGPTGGEINEIPPRHNAEGHTWHHGDCILEEIIRDGPEPRPEAPEDFPTMPAFADELRDDDIAAVLAYIRTWWTEEQREFQDERTREDCVRD
ncbi:MAG: cytochrome c [Actinobacteria bacterium]|nr:cytochrome c [Actinomycetota bacterium]